MKPPRYNVLGVGIHAVNLGQATEFLRNAARRKAAGYVCCCEAHSLTRSRADPQHRLILNQALLATPDGMPVVWMGRRQGHAAVDRVYGPDLLQTLCRQTAASGQRHYFYGGQAGVAADLAATLSLAYPGLTVAGSGSPPMTDNVTELPTDAIRAAAPDFLWVGLSTPKQEAFMHRFVTTHPDGPICIGVGAAFDFLTGRVRQAPPWIQRSGFEWLWRLTREPLRLGPRYLKTVPRFALRLLAQNTGLKTYALDD